MNRWILRATVMLLCFSWVGALTNDEKSELFHLEGTSFVTGAYREDGRFETRWHTTRFETVYRSCLGIIALGLVLEEVTDELHIAPDEETTSMARVTARIHEQGYPGDTVWTVVDTAHEVEVAGCYVILTQRGFGDGDDILKYYQLVSGHKYVTSTVPIQKFWLSEEPGLGPRYASYRSLSDIDMQERSECDELNGILQYSDKTQIRSEVAILYNPQFADDMLYRPSRFEVLDSQETRGYYLHWAEGKDTTCDQDVLAARSVRIKYWDGHEAVVPVVDDALDISRAIVSGRLTLRRHDSRPYRPGVPHR